MSYVTGSHNLKFGYTHEIGPDGRMGNEHNGDIQLSFNNGLRQPGDGVQHAARGARQGAVRLGVLHAGLVDAQAAHDQSRAPHRVVRGRHGGRRARPPAGSRRTGSIQQQHDLIKWGPDYAPRFAAAYDLFGNGRTALKTNFSKYHRQYDADPFLVYADAALRSEHRNWLD